MGDNNNVTLDRATKEYINTTIEEEGEIKIDASIGWLNANQRTGGAYIYDIGRIIPFDIPKSATLQTLEVLSGSHTDYFLGNSKASRISITVRRFLAIDGTEKRYLLLEASEIEDE